jgi:hypothetical protein
MIAFHRRSKLTLFLSGTLSPELQWNPKLGQATTSQKSTLSLCRKQRVQIEFVPSIEMPVVIVRPKTKKGTR